MEAKVTLTRDLRSAVLAFARGESTFDELQDWLAAHVQAIADDPGQDARELADEIWFLVDDYSHRILTREALQRELAKAVSSGSPKQRGPR